MLRTKRERLAWAAGLVDGEGCFTTKGITPSGATKIQFSMAQKDIEVLHDFQGIVRVGRIEPHNGDQFKFVVLSYRDVQHIAASLWFGLGTIKRDQASRILASWHKSRGLRV